MLRREFLAGAAAAGLAASLGPAASASAATGAGGASPVAAGPARPIVVFTKHLQFIRDFDELAGTAASLGFDGLDLTVRKGGHVEPENAPRDLPRAHAAALKAGVSLPMITTAVESVLDPKTEPLLRAAAELGIRVYRIGNFGYSPDQPIPERIEQLRGQFGKLAELNAKLGVTAAYQNHSGSDRVGAPVWDLWEIIKDLDPAGIGFNYDIGHATLEGGESWPLSWRLAAPRARVVTVKDFVWKKGNKGWSPEWTPLGEGMVDLDAFLAMVKRDGFAGPISQHFEYKLKEGEPTLAAMRRDLPLLRAALKRAGLEG